MKEIVQAKSEIDQIEESVAGQYKKVIKDLLSGLNPKAFPTGPSNRGRIQAFEVGYTENNPVIATPQGLFIVEVIGTESLHESSSRYVQESMVEASNKLYRQFTPKILDEIESRERLRNQLKESLKRELLELEQSSFSSS